MSFFEVVTTRSAYRCLLVALALLPLSSAVSAVLVLVAAVLHWRSGEAVDVGIPLRVWGLLFVAVAVSVGRSVSLSLSWPSLLLCGGYLTVIWAVGAILTTGARIWIACWVLCWTGAASAALGIVQSLLRWHYDVSTPLFTLTLGTWDNRAISVFSHPNIFSSYLLLTTGLSLALLLCREGYRTFRGRLLAGGILLVLLVCQILTQSRSGWIGTAVTLALVGSLSSRRLLVGGMLGVAGGAALFWHRVVPRFMTLFSPTYLSNSDRIRVWKSALEMIRQRPWTGWGPGTWPLVYPFYRDPAEIEHLPHAHDLYLMVGAEYGLVALACLLLVIAATAWAGLRGLVRSRTWHRFGICLAGALVGYLTVGLFEFTFSEGRNSILFFTLLGLLLAAGRSARIEQAAPGLSERRSPDLEPVP